LPLQTDNFFMKKIFPLLFLLALLFPIHATHAITILPSCAISGNGGFCCAMLTASNIARVILGAMGAAALGYFIFGGYKWITSMGESGKIAAGQKIMVNTVIGLIFIVLAWVIVNLIIVSFATGKPDNARVVLTGADSAWYEICQVNGNKK